MIAEIAAYLDTWTKLETDTRHILLAAEMISDFSLGLRLPDAIHIAIARDQDCPLISSDIRQLAAARKLGQAAFDPRGEI